MTYDENIASEKNTIIRKAKKNNFSIISNIPVRDEELSWKAKGILWYLLQLPDDWKINQKHLEKQSTDGKDSLASGMKELQEKGYIVHEIIREKGKIKSHMWIVHEQPILKNDIDCKKPEPENPVLVNPVLENPPLLNTKDSESKDSESLLKTKSIVATGVALSADADEIVSFFIQKLRERKPDFKFPKDFKKWHEEIDRMIRVDKRDPKKIKDMIDWIHRDSFWSSNILSPKKLREQYDNIDGKAKFNFEKNNIKKNKEYAIRLKFKYPETYKNLAFGEKFLSHIGTGKEIPLNLPPENFKRSFVTMFGLNFNDLSEVDRK